MQDAVFLTARVKALCPKWVFCFPTFVYGSAKEASVFTGFHPTDTAWCCCAPSASGQSQHMAFSALLAMASISKPSSANCQAWMFTKDNKFKMITDQCQNKINHSSSFVEYKCRERGGMFILTLDLWDLKKVKICYSDCSASLSLWIINMGSKSVLKIVTLSKKCF